MLELVATSCTSSRTFGIAYVKLKRRYNMYDRTPHGQRAPCVACGVRPGGYFETTEAATLVVALHERDDIMLEA